MTKTEQVLAIALAASSKDTMLNPKLSLHEMLQNLQALAVNDEDVHIAALLVVIMKHLQYKLVKVDVNQLKLVSTPEAMRLAVLYVSFNNPEDELWRSNLANVEKLKLINALIAKASGTLLTKHKAILEAPVGVIDVLTELRQEYIEQVAAVGITSATISRALAALSLPGQPILIVTENGERVVDVPTVAGSIAELQALADKLLVIDRKYVELAEQARSIVKSMPKV